MKNILKIISQELALFKKEYLIISSIILLISILYLNFDILNSRSFPGFIMTVLYTVFSISFEIRFFKDRLYRITRLPLSRFQLFLINTFRISAIIFLLNFIFLSIYLSTDLEVDEKSFDILMIIFPMIYFGISQLLIAVRNINNADNKTVNKALNALIYIIYLGACISGLIFIGNEFIIIDNKMTLILTNLAFLLTFVLLILPANYIIYKNRGDYK